MDEPYEVSNRLSPKGTRTWIRLPSRQNRNDGHAGINARAARTKDRPNNIVMTDQFTRLFHGRFTNRAPSISRSFDNNCRKTIAAGSMTPAST